MISKEQKIRLTIFLVLASLLLITILAVFIYPELKESGDTYVVKFKGTSVNGLNEGADVKYQGVKIGIVSRIDVDPQNLDSILVFVRLQTKFPVKEDMRAALQYAGITGLRFLEISGGRIGSKLVPPGGEILTKKGLGEKAEDIVLNIDSVVEAVNEMLNPENRQKFTGLLENLEKSTKVIAKIMENKEENVGNTLEKMDYVITDLIEVSGNLKEFSAYLMRLSEKIPVEKIASNVETISEDLKQRLSQQELGKVLNSTDTFLNTASSSIRKIENRILDLESELNRTLGSLRESVENISQFTRDLREDPTLFLLKRPEKRRKK